MKHIIKKILKESLKQASNISDYRFWLKNVVKPIKISSFTKIHNVNTFNNNIDDIEKYQETMLKNRELRKFIIDNIEPNDCFNNAYKAFVLLNQKGYNVKFVLGLMVENGKMFGHAWNIVNDVTVDFTSEKLKKNNNKYFQVVVLSDLSNIQGLDVFNPNSKCEQGLDIDNYSYDINGMCSIYPYYMSLKNN